MNFIQSYKWMVPPILFSLALIAGRVIYTSTLTFLFLPWNLFLAIIPLYFSCKLETAANKKAGWLYAAAWLLFFPNAMYIITDLFHLKDRGDIPLWYDLLLLLSAGLNGVIIGFISLHKVERWMLGFLKRPQLSIVIFGLLLLCGYGIYLGRYERWNSWDVVCQPFSLFMDIGHDVVHPIRHLSVWILSTSFAVWMYLLYHYVSKAGLVPETSK